VPNSHSIELEDPQWSLGPHPASFGGMSINVFCGYQQPAIGSLPTNGGSCQTMWGRLRIPSEGSHDLTPDTRYLKACLVQCVLRTHLAKRGRCPASTHPLRRFVHLGSGFGRVGSPAVRGEEDRPRCTQTGEYPRGLACFGNSVARVRSASTIQD